MLFANGSKCICLLTDSITHQHAVGTCFALAHAAQSVDGKEIQVMIAIDNLLKGAAGQAIQAMNLALGLPEAAGLGAVGAFPY